MKEMTPDQARKRLQVLWARRRKIDEEIKQVRALIPKVDLKKRNRMIYRKFLQHVPVADLAVEYGLSKDRIKIICSTLAAQKK